jgi:hypothetical protein
LRPTSDAAASRLIVEAGSALTLGFTEETRRTLHEVL